MISLKIIDLWKPPVPFVSQPENSTLSGGDLFKSLNKVNAMMALYFGARFSMKDSTLAKEIIYDKYLPVV